MSVGLVPDGRTENKNSVIESGTQMPWGNLCVISSNTCRLFIVLLPWGGGGGRRGEGRTLPVCVLARKRFIEMSVQR